MPSGKQNSNENDISRKETGLQGCDEGRLGGVRGGGVIWVMGLFIGLFGLVVYLG